jgi:hypothetical protein
MVKLYWRHRKDKAMRKSLMIVMMLSASAIGQEFTSSPAKRALKEYQTEVKRLDELYVKALNSAKGKYAENLDSARKTALIVRDLDEAQRILAAKNSIPKDNVPWFIGTEWENGTIKYRWTKDGQEEWVKGKLFRKIPWMILDERQVMTAWEYKGKKYIAIWKFDSNNANTIRYDHNPTVGWTAKRVK